MQHSNSETVLSGNGEVLKTSSSSANLNGNEKSSAKVAANVRKSRSFMELSLNSSNSVKSLGRNERRVLVIYTGGTIGMVKNRDGGKSVINILNMCAIKTYLQLTDWRLEVENRPEFRSLTSEANIHLGSLS